jgi:branched-chain amino acid aminotransferase
VSGEPANGPQFLIEIWLIEEYSYNKEGFVVDVFDPIRKSTDSYSNLKSANYLPSVISAIFAKENRLDECLLLNCHQRVCDATIANVFWIQDKTVFTPSLREGGIAGVMRGYLLRKLPEAGFAVTEENVDATTLLQADEIFLTNVIRGIRWVKSFRQKEFANQLSSAFFHQFISPLMMMKEPG